jgi:hypothetical protein
LGADVDLHIGGRGRRSLRIAALVATLTMPWWTVNR